MGLKKKNSWLIHPKDDIDTNTHQFKKTEIYIWSVYTKKKKITKAEIR